MDQRRDWKILIVEDDSDSAEALVTLFDLYGIEASWAVDGAGALMALDAIVRLDQRPPSFILLDINLPNTDTVKLSRELLSHPAGSPIVLTSASSQRVLDQMARETGAIAALRKPYSLDSLFEVFRGYEVANQEKITRRVAARR